MKKQISLNEFKEDVSIYIDYVMDSGLDLMVKECETTGIAIIPIEEYNALKRIASQQAINA
ncbi:type II toxin-antitoxin system Phd/YefM family antitoxin [Myroides sp. M-43]|uniref:type II toxin-antitoxin system Phd/YefM family antitoxin n=1 Tax=Myroides oncorhynchi TaxID=2893756 RepID=UPI001E60D2EE|nr:type II toxin-antitoxin system Phd/YefM family antitoxin [Myroides oncorhynchi]MCC9042993.1 type II toxin-antitoxin system Phd/YefM family antitoxin [Myroides oncorhynchi]